MNGLKSILNPYRGLPRDMYILALARTINAAGMFVFPLTALILTRKIGYPEQIAGLFLTVIGFVKLPANWIGGKLSDRFGYKRIYLLFTTLSMTLYLLCAFVPPGGVMVLLIVLASAGSRAAGPVLSAMVAELTTPEQRKGAFSLSYIGFNLGYALGPMIGGLLFENHLPWVFIGDAVTGYLSMLLFLLFVHPPEKACVYLPDNAQPVGEEPDTMLVDTHAPVPKSTLQVLRGLPLLLRMMLISCGVQMIYAQWGYLLPMQTTHLFGKSGAAFYGMMSSVNGLIVVLATPLFTHLLLKWRSNHAIAMGVALYAVSTGLFAFAQSKPALLVLFALFSCAEVIMTTQVVPFVQNQIPSGYRGRLNGVLQITDDMGRNMGPAVMGLVLLGISLPRAWVVVGAFGCVLALVALRFLEKRSVHAV